MSGESNTVTISLKDYNELRDFNKAILENKCVSYIVNGFGDKVNVYTKSKVIDDIVSANKRLAYEIEMLNKEIDELKMTPSINSNEMKKQPSLDVSKISILDFIKLKLK